METPPRQTKQTESSNCLDHVPTGSDCDYASSSLADRCSTGVAQKTEWHEGNESRETDVQETPSLAMNILQKALSGVSHDWDSIALLLVLYTVQGIPMGLSGSIPFLLQGKISYAEQGLFSLVSLPFSLKLLWAPIVDSVYSQSFGRRRSWLIPVQMCCGVLMLYGADSGRVDDGIENADVSWLTVYFSVLYFLMATQDIAVDGWALTMLSESNRGYASTCNTIGQTLGFFIAHVGFLALNDARTCNRFLRRRNDVSDVGIVTLSGFIRFWAWVMICSTLFVLFFKTEERSDPLQRASSNQNKAPHRQRAVWHSASVQPSASNNNSMQLRVLPREGDCSTVETPSSQWKDNERCGCRKDSAAERQLNNRRFLKRVIGNGNPNDEGDADTVAAEGGVAGSPPTSDCQWLDRFELQERTAQSLEPNGVLETYVKLWELLWLPPVQWLILVLMTCRIPFSVTDSATHFKMMEFGISKEELAFLAPFVVPFGIVCPMVVGKHIAGPRPLRLFSCGFFLRMFVTLLWAGVLPLTRSVCRSREDSGGPFWYYCLIYAVTCIHNIASDLMFVSLMAFYARVSDPSIGGTYMTFLNTLTNLGSKWTSAASLFLLDYSTVRLCINDDRNGCIVWLDGYYVQAATCLLFGCAWIFLLKPRVDWLQRLPPAAWTLT